MNIVRDAKVALLLIMVISPSLNSFTKPGVEVTPIRFKQEIDQHKVYHLHVYWVALRWGHKRMLIPTFSTGENDTTEGYIVTPRTKALLQQHLKETGGKVSDASSILSYLDHTWLHWLTYFR